MSTPPMNPEMPKKGRRLALIIGVNHAPSSPLPPLEHAVADAKAMAETLQQNCHFQLIEPPLLNEQATSEKVKTAVLDFAEDRTDEDFLLLYFSGHGQPMLIEAGRQDVYLVTSNFRPRDVERDENLHFSMRWLRDKLYVPTKAGRVLLILDCCYAGDIGRTAPDPYLEDLHTRITYYFGAPGRESGARQGGLRLALTATGHGATATEKAGYGLMTGQLLPALRGEVDEALDDDGQVSLQRLFEYLQHAMPPEQQPSLAGDFAGRACILAHYLERVAALRSKRRVVHDRPQNYIPFPRDPLFQPRSGEFERLETLLFRPGGGQKPTRLGFVGVVGMGGIGKTQLAVELAYRCLDQHRFPSGIFWTPATGTSLFDWQQWLAELAAKTDYLPPDDDPSTPENEARRARHLCRYLASHDDALLILDNVETPTLVTSALPALAGGELACTILYTSRNRQAPSGAITYPVELLSEETALRLLLETTRPSLLPEVLAGSQSTEAQAAREICRAAGYLPLTLVMLRGLLEQDQQASLEQLNEALKQPGVLEAEKKTRTADLALLSSAFRLSWERVRDERAQRLFKLAAYFPEAIPIPLWLLGLAAGLGESCRILNSLWRARADLQKVSLIEVLIGDQVRLHPLVRAFGRGLVAEELDKGKALLKEAGKRLTAEFVDLNKLERRAQREGYWNTLEQVRAARGYAELLDTQQKEQLGRLERWLDRESHLLGDERWWPEVIPGLFYQQLYNRGVEEGYSLPAGEAPAQWLRQVSQVGAEDQSLIRVYAGHTDAITSVAFSPDGTKVLTGSTDGTARLWDASSGKVLLTLAGHTKWVMSVAFSPDGTKVLTGSTDGTARLWETASGEVLATLVSYPPEYTIGVHTPVAFSPDGTKVLTTAYNGTAYDSTACLWETTSGKMLVKLKEPSLGGMRCVSFSPDGTKVLAGHAGGPVALWEVATGELLAMWESQTYEVTSIAFSLDGTKVLTGNANGPVHLWDWPSGKLLAELKSYDLSGVTSVAFSPDGTKVFTGSYDRTACLWETASGKILAVLTGHTDSVNSVAFSPDGTKILTGSNDGTARLWDSASGKVPETLKNLATRVGRLVFSPDGTKVLAGSFVGPTLMWEVSSGEPLTTWGKQVSGVTSADFSPDGSLVLTGSFGAVQLWDAVSGERLVTLKCDRNEYVGELASVAFSPTGTRIFASTEDEEDCGGSTHLWDWPSRKVLAELPYASVKSVAFSPDGTKVLTYRSGRMDLWDATSGKLLVTLDLARRIITNMAFSPDGTRVLTGLADGEIRLWETTTWRLLASLKGHMDSVVGVTFSPSGRFIMTCDSRGLVLLWQANGADMGKLLGAYTTAYEVGSIHWQNPIHVMLADTGGLLGRPHLYQLMLEGTGSSHSG